MQDSFPRAADGFRYVPKGRIQCSWLVDGTNNDVRDCDATPSDHKGGGELLNGFGSGGGDVRLVRFLRVLGGGSGGTLARDAQFTLPLSAGVTRLERGSGGF